MTTPTQLIDDLRLLEPPNPWLIYYWVGGSLLVLLLLVGLVKLIRAWRRRRVTGSFHDIKAAQRDALEALQELFEFVQQERGKEYATESSAIIRNYIERRFDIRTSIRSTEEFLHEAQHSPLLAPEHQDLLGHYLSCCDYLKFARGIASREELEDLHAIGVQFITETSASSGGGAT